MTESARVPVYDEGSARPSLTESVPTVLSDVAVVHGLAYVVSVPDDATVRFERRRLPDEFQGTI